MQNAGVLKDVILWQLFLSLLPPVQLGEQSTMQGTNGVLQPMCAQECSMRIAGQEGVITSYVTKLTHHLPLKQDKGAIRHSNGVNAVHGDGEQTGVP